MFEGDITTTSVSQPPDIVLTIKALTSQFQKGNIVTNQVPTISTLSQIAENAADSLGVRLDFQGQDQQINNYRYEGSAAGQINKLGDITAMDLFVDDDVLVVKERNQPIAGRQRVLNLSLIHI